MKLAGTMCVFVTRSALDELEALRASHFGMTTTVAPNARCIWRPERRARVVRGTDQEVHVVGTEAPPFSAGRDADRPSTEVVLADRDALGPSSRARRVRHHRGPPVADDVGRLDLTRAGAAASASS